ncbi:hypothetical protein Mal4_03190 [Maioricimonas rarisocia]|uniref:Enolase C-terminal domain-containing protein n=1 Tax=Maioricimonas rarisocia TaxID=2528026 RepID=A0A517Z0M3_9PLAN|nr:hypothetical protein [Maioricimonas rarisocia]QDU36036.1 hypothetical protein Mal4_03190 [Maioricimonas rarisocia]
MAYHIESIDLFVRETPPNRMTFTIGKQKGADAPPPKRRPRGILLVRMQLTDDQGRRTWGVAGDRPSFGWLDKRSDYGPEEKLDRLLALVRRARDLYLEQPRFDTPFEQWHDRLEPIRLQGKAANHEGLSIAYASALFERAMIDAVCRMEELSFFEAVRQNRLGFDAGSVFPELKSIRLQDHLPQRPRTRFAIRHTVGLADPLTADDLPESERVNDGEPETLAEYVQRDGLKFFKVKISGDAEADLHRLGRIWDVIVDVEDPVVTLDGNESYTDINAFARFVERFEAEQLGIFQHTSFIEQPLTRALTHDPSTADAIAKITRHKPVIIDEADESLDSFPSALAIGYSGTSHKNCKGVFKSLVNFCRCRQLEAQDRIVIQSGEDLSNMPMVPLHQDFAALGVLDILDCERNGHHYSYGLSHLTETEKRHVRTAHRDLYTPRDGELFLNIRNGMVQCESLQCRGFGVAFPPEWNALIPLDDWDIAW